MSADDWKEDDDLEADGNGDEEFEDSADTEQIAAQGGVGLCMVLLRQPTLDPAILASELSKEFDREIELEVADDNIFSCELGDLNLFFMALEVPIPNQEAEHAADGYFLWDDGAQAVAEHQGHVIVTCVGQDDDVLEKVVVAARGARAVLQASDSIGVYWGNGMIANNAETFLTMSEGLSDDALPLYLWMRFQPLPGDTEETVGLYTLGLEQFDVREIEVQNCSWTPSDMLEFVFNVAHYLIVSGRTIADGDTIGGDADQRITVSYEPSVVDPERTVHRIHLP